MCDKEFVQHFRLTKDAFKYVLTEVKDKLKKRSRTSALSAELKFAATLRFLVEGSYQLGAGNDFNIGIAQSTMSGVLKEVLDCLEEQICPKWITMEMTNEEKMEAKQHFYENTHFPGVIGCVDGTQIRIITPCRDQQYLYFNRKGLPV
ncbi:PREDICTED: uncharacterized protein LOC108371140 [Rhagoletis zephyria]|uniref:uncharacterized protein LOC108361570 n=1 Tax=Rhagoletis zephyria TaxID=28612 RepID=UPI0008113BF5|nr:PREDICTED: uncharacterized protein LOC108361570 [Rhagoletis zephyria]XP_017469703.1 PREDICTED: uncharacterized protein LOC108361571 [Rhagoletis zephyria]XP_017482131.1 PREDICTED: uncharacterized protein LOC108371139 [Rhagoletis zephyria]XP_017482132.1 PREDICTED: uncharacterized protein LOC108371140 [Rhagoletis zephyria]XP_036346570.1 uncharacterized protein LOC118755869 [Rhagoletis pomonella]